MIRSYRFEAAALEPSRREALAYLQVREADETTNALLNTAVSEAKRLAECRCRAGIFDLAFANTIDPVFRTRLEGYERFVLFCATLGHDLDRAIARTVGTSPAKAAMLDAAGGALVEALCDELERTLKKEWDFAAMGKRFSPGYGGLPLSAQRRIFDILELSRIGVGLNSSLLLSPAKTVTAMFGVR